MRKSFLKASHLALFALIVLLPLVTACGTLELGIERTATGDTALGGETAPTQQLTATYTPPTQDERLAATVAALATQNAYLATNTASPTNTPSPVPLDRIGYPPDWRMGIDVLDAIIAAVLADDPAAMRDLVHYTQTGCTHALGLGGPPKCEADEAEGTLVEVLPIMGPGEGSYVRRDDIERAFPSGGKTLYGVYRVSENAYAEAYWPAGEYGIIFIDNIRPPRAQQAYDHATITYLADAQGIVRIDHDFSVPTLFERLERDLGEFILPPLDVIPVTTVQSGRWAVYSNPFLDVSLEFPATWQPVPGQGDPITGVKYAGEDGFFLIGVLNAGGATIDDVAARASENPLQSYGSSPTIESLTVQGQEARLILPSADQPATMSRQAELIVRYPDPVEISGTAYDFITVAADQDHIRRIAQSLRFDGGSPGQVATPEPVIVYGETLTSTLPAIPPDFWESVGASPETLVAVLIPSDSGRPRFGDIGTMHLDGTNLVQLTTYAYNADPVLSPDRQRIAYRSVPKAITSLDDPEPRLNEGLFNIWVITVDGVQALQLTNSELQRGVPTWSPDSRKVAFTEGPNDQLVEIDLDTAARRHVTPGAAAPRYRPDGDGIAYITQEGGLVWMDAAGTEHAIVRPETLPPNTSVEDFDWLPDSQHIVYTLADETERVDPNLAIGVQYSVWTTQIDGSNPTKLADDAHSVQVSPDGQIVAALTGSGFGDACFVDKQAVFLLLAEDLTSARQAGVEDFAGYPQIGSDASFYPSAGLSWVSGRVALGDFRFACVPDPSAAGSYIIDPLGERLFQVREID